MWLAHEAVEPVDALGIPKPRLKACGTDVTNHDKSALDQAADRLDCSFRARGDLVSLPIMPTTIQTLIQSARPSMRTSRSNSLSVAIDVHLSWRTM
jgi:hypothetical protein